MTIGTPETRPSALSDRDIAMLERLAAVMSTLQRPGATVHTGDARVDQIQVWFIGVCAVGILGLLAWSIDALVNQGLVLREVVTQMQGLDKRVERLEAKP